jgi:hypothetical protein
MQQIVHMFRLPGQGPPPPRHQMSRQLSLSATFSALAMVLFALVMRTDGGSEVPPGGGEAPLIAEISLG